MKIKRFCKITITLLTLGGMALLGCVLNTPKSDTNSRLKAEQEVYSLLITGDYVFEEYTNLGELDLSQESIQHIKDELVSLDNDTLDDFQSQNKKQYLLKDYLPPNTDYVLLSNTEVQSFFTDWVIFSANHPNTHTITSFSRVGLNSSFTQALVLVNTDVKILDSPFEYSGSGLIYLFSKIGDKWIEQNQLIVSITG